MPGNELTDAGIQGRFRVDYDHARQGFSLDVEFSVPGQGVTAIFGPSGSGKTTLLRCIAGLQRADQGFLTINGDCWQTDEHFVPTHKRPLGYVFQEPSLFPHLRAVDNLRYACKRSAVPVSEDFYQHVISTLGIAEVLSHYPAALSGGERQRVAIARALLIQPRLLLMDEPLASLDQARKQEVLPYLERLHRELDIPVFYVTHSLAEVTRLADHLMLLDHGRITACGSLREVFSRTDLALAQDEEAGVVLDGQVVERDPRWQLARIGFADGELWVSDSGVAEGDPLRLRILARDISLTLTAQHDSSIVNRLPVTVQALTDHADSAMTLVRLETGGTQLIARLTRRSAHHLQLQPGKQLWAQIKSVAIVR